MVALMLRGHEAKSLILTVMQEEEWQLYAPEGKPLGAPELPFKIEGVWAEDNAQSLAQNVSLLVVELKLGVHPSVKNSTSFPTGSVWN
jgi:hypothetical protein